MNRRIATTLKQPVFDQRSISNRCRQLTKFKILNNLCQIIQYSILSGLPWWKCRFDWALEHENRKGRQLHFTRISFAETQNAQVLRNKISVPVYLPLPSSLHFLKLVDIVNGRGVTNECYQAESIDTGMNPRWQFKHCLSKNVVCKLQ